MAEHGSSLMEEWTLSIALQILKKSWVHTDTTHYVQSHMAI